MQNTVRGIRLTPAQADVYRVLRRFRGGLTDTALVPLVQHMAGSHQSSSGIRTRRAELLAKGLVVPTDKTERTGSGRTARVFRAA